VRINLVDNNLPRDNMLAHQPMPGYWYTNIVGQLQQVRIVLHEGSRQRLIVLENINGKRQNVDLDGWYRLDLTLHSPGVECRRRRRDDSSQGLS
jgi:hypothetical protein